MKFSKYGWSTTVADFRSLNVLESFLPGRQVKQSNSSCQLAENKPSTEKKEEFEERIIDYYPNCDSSIWTRSCENEVIEPIKGQVSGVIPPWLKGTLLRNGPGSLKVGEYSFNHIFDSSALVHRFAVANGEVTYQRRFVQTEAYKRNQAAQRIVVTEFGTSAVPDPCQTIFQRVASVFNPVIDTSDNSMISVYPFGDEYYTFSEAAIIHRIDPKTLETMGRVNIAEYINIVHHSSHPHVMKDGTVYNVGTGVTPSGPVYNVICFSPSSVVTDENGEEKEVSMFEQATVVATIPSRWILNPSYMHTFGITENYFIIVEQPFAISLLGVVSGRLTKEPLCSALRWHENERTVIHVLSRESGKLVKTFTAETFFYLHIINQFETWDKDYIVLDICCYKDAQVLNCMYVDMIKDLHKNPDYATKFRGRPLRFVLPMKEVDSNVQFEENLIASEKIYRSTELHRDHEVNKFENGDKSYPTESYYMKKENKAKEDWKSILKREAAAHRLPDGSIFVKPELLCDMGCEIPRINLESCLGREYRYFYAVASDVDLEHPGLIIKVDTVAKTKLIWCEDNAYPSEPIFVPNPNGKTEDDGVILSSLVWSRGLESRTGLLILDAMTLKEIARATFETYGPVPKCLHGWFSMGL